jgi:hypothetical protein
VTEKNRISIKEAAGDYKHSLVRGLLFDLRNEKLPEPVTEHVFHPTREWKFDAAYVPEKIAIEVEGGTGWKRDVPSRHLTPSGFAGDIEKYNAASILGWKLLRFTPAMLRDGTAIETIRRALKARRKEQAS